MNSKSDVLINKAAVIEKCVRRIREEYDGPKGKWLKNYTRQDSIILNLQRACEAAIDMGAHLIRLHKLGVPQDSRDIFSILESKALISEKVSKQMQSMVGFRNIAVHEYQSLKFEIVSSILDHHLNDFLEFSKSILKSPQKNKR